ncbi:MAG: GNAT family N-acetyltransferase [Vicinamibacteria bacterium]|nr:GNAT family N-acetyltransferase [Vicinamibacteria bacterium]
MTAETLALIAAVHSKVPPAEAPGTSLRVETVSDPATFTAMRGPWSQLLAESRSNTVFLTWEWLHSWWRHLAGDRRLALLTVRRAGELVAIAPFAASRNRWLGLSTLEFLGTGRVGSDYLDMIIRRGEEAETLQTLTDHVVRGAAVMDLRQVLASSASRRMASALRRSGCSIRARRTHRALFIDLRGLSFEAYLAGLGSQHRYNFQRRLRKLESSPGFAFECASSPARRAEVLKMLFELHRLRWEGRGGDGLVGQGVQEFHEEFSTLALERGWLRLFVLWLDGAPAATLYAFRHGSVFSFYQSGFDPRFSKLSVGLVALGLAIKSAIGEGAREFDLLHGVEPYKFHWASESRSLSRVVTFPPSALGRTLWSGSTAVEGLRDVKRGLKNIWTARPFRRRIGGTHAAPSC